MNKTDLIEALQQLGGLCPPGTEIVLAGGAALILGGYIDRATADGDVVHARPRLADLKDLIALVADERGLAAGWLNDGIKAWADVLPPDFHERLTELGNFGNLRVRSLGRRDLILMKLFALRAGDVEDLESLAPTPEEIAFVRNQLERIGRVYPDRALRMQLYLDQGESRQHPATPKEDASRGTRRKQDEGN